MPRTVEFTVLVAAISFFGFFLYSFWTLTRRAPALDILSNEASDADRLPLPASSFVAMEYFWLILNRTFVVFSTPNALYGWKASGPVSNADRDYFQPLVEMTLDRELTQDLAAIRKLSELSGGFCIARSSIVSVESSYKSKWGMGGILHSGRVTITTNTRRSREFILLGSSADPDSIKDAIWNGR
ncbi:hypothetical protein [Acidicapsa ligni]|uniref:hypothetical protein n=1 Tax=Acidicapsa ligni TaxID=542300 RepID=UPI0021E08116|nr:hypothetical protein [Acidicapsa ligni]